MTTKSRGIHFTFLVLGQALIGYGIYLRTHSCDLNQCNVTFIDTPLLVIGAILCFVSLLGLINTACCHSDFIKNFQTFVLASLSFGVFVFFLFGLANSIKPTKPDPGVADYSRWLNGFVRGENWKRIRHCLVESRICSSDRYHEALSRNALTSKQDKCCNPPSMCGFDWIDSRWTQTSSQETYKDCTRWIDDPQKLCYDCDSCKVKFLTNISSSWTSFVLVLLCFVFPMLFLYTCCSCENDNPAAATGGDIERQIQMAAV